MTSYIESATVINNGRTIKIDYRTYRPGTMNEYKTDFLDAVPFGNWTSIQFYRCESVPYHKFLETMVRKNNKVLIKMAGLVHDAFLSDACGSARMEWLLYKLCILDKTFEPGRFNLKCGWQRDLLKDICTTSAVYVIRTCHNNDSLFRYYRTISSQLEV